MDGSIVPTQRTKNADLRIRQNFLRFFVFWTGAAVMAVEFSAQRLLEPFFGNSELVWATLIGTILLALSGGYAVGGRLADKWPTPKGIGLLSLGAGIVVATLPLLTYPLLAAVSGGLLQSPASLVLASLVGTSALFVLPVAALGAVSPYAVRLAVQNRENVGSKAGSLYFWSTFGSIVGTFLPTLYTIPSFGVKTTLWISATILLALGIITTGKPVFLFGCLLPLALGETSPSLLKPVRGLITEVETPYQFAEVYKLNSNETALSVNDSTGIQSIYTTKRLTNLYYDAFLTLPFMFPQSKNVNMLLVGMAAGTIPTLYEKDVDPFRARVDVTGIEIDPKLIQLGKQYFGLKTSAARVINADARVYLNTTKNKYDLMIIDAYSQEIYIPFHLTTREFFKECMSHLNTDGILAMNINVTSPDAPLMKAVERTLSTVFPNVYIAKAPGAYNEIVIASRQPVALPSAGYMPSFLQQVTNSLAVTWTRPDPGKGIVLTDNRAPIEEMTNAMILQKLGSKL